MTPESSRVISLREYADAVSLSGPRRRAEPLAGADRRAVVKHLVVHLSTEDPSAQNRLGGVGIPDEPRALLRALLTIRPPGRLPDGFHRALDALLAAELNERGVTDAATVRRVSSVRDTALTLWRGDITTIRTDVIVNAANSALLGCFRPLHTCIDNAIHCGAGPRLRDDCATIMALQGHAEPTGHAKVTRGHNLPARYVFHTVGPIANGVHDRTNARALARCYHACLESARELGDVRTIAFCGISTGVFGYPKVPACRIALRAVAQWLQANPYILDLIIFNVFSAEDEAIYERELRSTQLYGAVN